MCAQIIDEKTWGESKRFLAALRWAAKRVGPSTHWLDLVLSAPRCIKSSTAENELIAAFRDAQQLGQLLCLHADVYSRDDKVAQGFLLWLLKHVPSLLALNMGDMPPPPPNAYNFQFLRHLQLGGESLPRTFRPAKDLPVLKTLCITGCVSEKHQMDLLGCQHLSKLAMKGCSTQQMPMEPACHFSADLGILNSFLEKVWCAPYEAFLHSVCELSLDCQDPFYTSPESVGLFAGLPRLAVLKAAWPKKEMTFAEPERDSFVAGAECLLTHCLGSDGPPVLGLRVIILTAISMQARIPGHLPNLEQLVVLAEGRAELSFEDPEATILALKELYAFGQPLKPDGMDILRMSTALVGSDRALCGASAQKSGKGFEDGSSCLYLRPTAAGALSMQQVYDMVARLARACRCGACFDCLSKAGHLDF